MMSRLRGLGLAAVLAGALSAPALAASPLHPASFTLPDFSQTFSMRFFGETSDANATQNAVFGDRVSESPLREFVLRVSFIKPQDFSGLRVLPYSATLVRMSPGPALLGEGTLRAPRFVAAQTFTAQQSFVPDATLQTPQVSVAPSASAAAYRPFQDERSQAAPGTTVSFTVEPIAPTQRAITSFSTQLTPQTGYDAVGTGPDAQSGFAQNAANVSLPLAVDVGKVHLRGHVEGAQSQATSLSLETQSMGAGADATFHALRRDVQVNVGSSYEHLTRDSNTPFTSTSFDNTATLQLAPNGLVPIPAYADLSKRTVSAGVAVPVTHNVTVGAQYDQQRLLGGVGAAGVVNVDARNDIYGGNVTFRLPNNPAASISLSAKQYRFQDNIVPSNAFTQTRADLNFTVKFH